MTNRKIDLWEKIVHEAGLDLTKPVSYISANKIKRITGYEPRLLAKIDEESKLPRIFKENGVFILPVSRHEYAIVKGKGYHRLEDISSAPIIHEAHISPEIGFLLDKKITENTVLNYAYQTDLLMRFLRVSNLYEYFRGRMNTPYFTFVVDGSPEIKVDGAQIEIDESYINHGETIIVEAKVGHPKSFWIKQLYYPYRTMLIEREGSHVRSIFFVYEKKTRLFKLWEYDFDNPYDYESISLVQSGCYKIKVIPFKPEDYIRKEADLTDKIPQADSFEKVLLFPIFVSMGYINSRSIAKKFGFTVRQSSYYRQAAEMLGLVELRGKRYHLTKLGEEFVKKTPKERIKMAAKLLLRHPIMREVFIRVISRPDKPVTRDEVMDIIRSKSRLTKSTIPRRTQTIFKWFEWLQRNMGMVIVTRNEIRKVDASTLEKYMS